MSSSRARMPRKRVGPTTDHRNGHLEHARATGDTKDRSRHKRGSYAAPTSGKRHERRADRGHERGPIEVRRTALHAEAEIVSQSTWPKCQQEIGPPSPEQLRVNCPSCGEPMPAWYLEYSGCADCHCPRQVQPHLWAMVHPSPRSSRGRDGVRFPQGPLRLSWSTMGPSTCSMVSGGTRRRKLTSRASQTGSASALPRATGSLGSSRSRSRVGLIHEQPRGSFLILQMDPRQSLRRTCTGG